MSKPRPGTARHALAATLRAARENAPGRPSQNDIDHAIGFKPGNVTRWERGLVIPSPQGIARLVERLGLDIERTAVLYLLAQMELYEASVPAASVTRLRAVQPTDDLAGLEHDVEAAAKSHARSATRGKSAQSHATDGPQ